MAGKPKMPRVVTALMPLKTAQPPQGWVVGGLRSGNRSRFNTTGSHRLAVPPCWMNSTSPSMTGR